MTHDSLCTWIVQTVSNASFHVRPSVSQTHIMVCGPLMSGTVLRLSERLLLAYSTQFDANKIVHCFLLLKVLFIFGFTESSLLCVPFPLVSGGGGHSLVVVLTAVVSFVAEHRLSSGGRPAYLLRGMWDPPGTGIEPVSPSWAGKFSTTRPPGKSLHVFLKSTDSSFHPPCWANWLDMTGTQQRAPGVRQNQR